MPERYEEARSLAKIQNNHLKVNNRDLEQSFSWVDKLPVAEFTPNVIFCREKKKGEEATNFTWLTNCTTSKRKVENLANKGGRLRWKIENEGFNVQKNDGYEMEHPYSEHANGFRVFYIMLLIGHYLSQLILNGSLIKSLAESFGTAKNFARRLSESFRNYLLPETIMMPGQIRFLPP